jgi:hypothetical protein
MLERERGGGGTEMETDRQNLKVGIYEHMKYNGEFRKIWFPEKLPKWCTGSFTLHTSVKGSIPPHTYICDEYILHTQNIRGKIICKL